MRQFWHRVELTDGSHFVVRCTEKLADVNARWGACEREISAIVREDPYWPAWTDEEVEQETGRTSSLLAILRNHASALRGGERWPYMAFGQTHLGNAVIDAARDAGATDDQIRKAMT